MSSKTHANSKDPSPPGHQAMQPEAQSAELHDQPLVPARAAQKARTASRLLTSHDLLRLQRTTGNQAVSRLLASPRSQHQSSPEVQRKALQVVIQRVGRDEVEEIADYMPVCVDNGEASRKAYKRNDGVIRGADDTDLFYADGDGDLVAITVDMVDAHFDPLYEGFEKISGPDRTKNCEDYAKEYAGFGAKSGDYANSDELTPLIEDQGQYVLQLSFHWLSVDNTDGTSVTIRQKDAESSVYQKTYDSVEAAATYILTKRDAGGTVYATG